MDLNFTYVRYNRAFLSAPGVFIELDFYPWPSARQAEIMVPVPDPPMPVGYRSRTILTISWYNANLTPYGSNKPLWLVEGAEWDREGRNVPFPRVVLKLTDPPRQRFLAFYHLILQVKNWSYEVFKALNRATLSLPLPSYDDARKRLRPVPFSFAYRPSWGRMRVIPPAPHHHPKTPPHELEEEIWDILFRNPNWVAEVWNISVQEARTLIGAHDVLDDL